MALTQEQEQAIAAILAGTAPVPSAPVKPVIASPFAGTSAGTATSVVSAARTMFPNDQAAQRAQVALSLAPRFTCSVDTTATVGTETVPSALHGFLTAKESGIPCPGIRGLAKDTACPGTIR